MRVLHIEADRAVARAVELMLRSEGMQVVATEEGGDGADLAGLYDYDIVLLDLDLGDMPGLDVLRQIRRAKIQTPVLVLTGDSSVDTKVRALNAGADDYLTKPFHKDELVARIHAVIRRAKGHAASTIGIGLLSVDLDRKVVEVDGMPVLLTGKEYQILEVLALRRGSVITKDAILDYLYGGRDEPELKIVDVFVCKLRKKLRAAGAGDVIQTEWGRGYALRAPTPGAAAA